MSKFPFPAFSTSITSFEQTIFFRILLGVGLLYAGSQISIPLEPVPITLQSVAVLLIGLYAKTIQEAFFTTATYLCLGMMGAPLFAEHSAGLAIFLRSTGGYLIGFMVCASLMSYLRVSFECKSWIAKFAICLIGSVSIFIFGLAWLAHLIGIKQALIVGLFPFILPGLIKSFVLSGIVQFIEKK